MWGQMWVARMYRAECPNTCIISNGFAAMGIALPGAIAAKIVHPEQVAVAVTGDAGFMMNCQELETAMRLGTPIIVLIWHDNEYGLIKWKQEVQFAESFGAKGYRVERAEDLLPTLKQAIDDKTVVVIDCPVDYSENLKLTEKLGKLHKMQAISIEIEDIVANEYQKGNISIRQGAKMLGLSYEEFMVDFLGERKISFINGTPSELEAEFQQEEAWLDEVLENKT